MGSDSKNPIQMLGEILAGLGSGNTMELFLVLAAIGVIAMAVLQVLKELTPIRRLFHQYWVRAWIDTRKPANSNAGSLEQDLIGLATGGDARAFYDLESEQVVAQINAATRIVLDYPTQNQALLDLLANGASAGDRDNLKGVANPPPTAEQLLESRNRVGNRIQRNLDGMQISMGNRWKWLMQLSSIGLTVVVVEVAIAYQAPKSPGVYVLGIILGLTGGYLAPVTRDLVAALEKLRRK